MKTLLVFWAVATAAVASAEADTSSPADALALAKESLARCCGKERATLGPLFGKLSIDPRAKAIDDAVLLDGLPDYLGPAKTGLTITLVTGLGPDRMHLDGVEVEVSDRGLCDELDKRLLRLWGRAPWVNRARHLSATLDRADPGEGTAACTLRIERIATSDAAHCLRDEEPNTRWEIDVRRKCLKPARARGCMLARDTSAHKRHCSVDEKHHTFWSTSGPSDDRACTDDELQLVDFDALRECGRSAAAPARGE